MTVGSMSKRVGIGLGVLLALSACGNAHDSDADKHANPAGSGSPPLTNAGTTGSSTRAPRRMRPQARADAPWVRPAAQAPRRNPRPVRPALLGPWQLPAAAVRRPKGARAAAADPTPAASSPTACRAARTGARRQQKGPCAAGTSIYGVTTEFGPYGASSEHNVGQGSRPPIDFAGDNAAAARSSSTGSAPTRSAAPI